MRRKVSRERAADRRRQGEPLQVGVAGPGAATLAESSAAPQRLSSSLRVAGDTGAEAALSSPSATQLTCRGALHTVTYRCPRPRSSPAKGQAAEPLMERCIPLHTVTYRYRRPSNGYCNGCCNGCCNGHRNGHCHGHCHGRGVTAHPRLLRLVGRGCLKGNVASAPRRLRASRGQVGGWGAAGIALVRLTAAGIAPASRDM